MGEEDLGVGGGLVREEDDKGRSMFVQYGAEGEVDLWETGCSSLTVQRMCQFHV